MSTPPSKTPEGSPSGTPGIRRVGPDGRPIGPDGKPMGPLFMRDEYKNLTEEFTKDVKKDLSKEVKSLLLIGSYVSEEHIAGESDCDFLIILNEKASGENFEKSMEAISKIVYKYLEDPLFGSIIDVEVLGANDVPTNGETEYPWTKVLVAQRGRALIGNNPFTKIKVKEEDVKISAKEMATVYLEQLEEIINDEEIDEYDKLYLTVEAVLGSGCAYLYYQGEKDFYRSSAIILFEDKYRNKLDIGPIQISHGLRLAAKTLDTKNYIPKSLDFCKKIVALLK
ncbi:MAG: nucleotidyltransferase domain-containing protein [Candidatus Heimdallarchaeota archaeon]|nr:nucleotidyltransferase domain-containing protein [Candidatus Heimdallarchaeota archaeon]